MNKKSVDINATRLIYVLSETKISEKASIKINLCEKRGNTFYDINLYIEDKEIFLGRFDKTEDSNIRVKYNDGKILIYNKIPSVNEENSGIKEVLGLYEIVDDTFYSCTAEEALQLFDSSIDTSYLKNKNNIIHRSDIEKRKRLEKSF